VNTKTINKRLIIGQLLPRIGLIMPKTGLINGYRGVDKIKRWTDKQHPIWINNDRIALGLFILNKNILNISNTKMY
jgi:hypothetical protein